MTTIPDTIAEILRRLAEAEVNGKARFPMFRKACRETWFASYRGAGPHDKECPCHGLGWLPLPEAALHLETLVEAASQLPAWPEENDKRAVIMLAFLEEGMLGAARALDAAEQARVRTEAEA